MKNPLTLSAMISMHAGAALLVFTLLSALLLNNGLTHVLEEALHDKANALVRQLSVISLDAVLVQDYGVLERYTSDLALEPDLLHLQIVRDDGVVLAQAGSIHGQNDVLVITQPMLLAGNNIGSVTVSYDKSRIRTISNRLFAVAMAAMLLLIWVLFLVLRRFVRKRLVEPVKALTDEMNPLLPRPSSTPTQQLDDQPAPLEVLVLRNAFEKMSEDVRSHLAEVDRANSVARAATQRLCQGQRLATIGQMAAGLAHGLNTPLGNIIGYTQQAISQADSADLVKKLEVIERQAHVCSDIVRNMLASVRAPELMIEDFDLSRLAQATLNLMRPIARDHGVQLPVIPDDNHLLVRADVASVEQILFNLVNNAVQAGAKAIKVSVQPRQDHACLRVCDDGSGIAEADQASIFEPFFTTKPASSGTGLGLYLCATLAESMHGNIRLMHSQPGDTCFELNLPRGDEE